MARKNSKRVGARNGESAMPLLKEVAGGPRTLDARPDTPDFRDKLYEATLVEVPPLIPLEDYQQRGVPILDQGQEGACTGFGLATVANYLLRGRKVRPDTGPVSPRMFYEMARRYDEWPGEDYSGSSARGAMKGWHKHGVCAQEVWPYNPNDPAGSLDNTRAADANGRPLGAYYRVNHQDLICMHSALAEVGVLYATAKVHDGWRSPDADGTIRRTENIIGGHAFAIVAFDHDGFWIQNSWGPDWGRDGFGHISYDDWLANGTDVWVARLGAPIAFGTPEATARGNAVIAGLGDGYTSATLRPHVISLGNDGQLQTSGTYGKTADEIRAVFDEDFPRITNGWEKKRILLYAHGGLVDEASAVQHIADYRPALLDARVYPVGFIWHSDFGSTLRNILSDALNSRRPEGFLDATKNFMLDRLDDALEPVARQIGGKAQWDEMRENATMATTTSTGGARLVAQCLAKLIKEDPDIEIHLIGHSAGSIFHAPLIQLLTGDPKKPFDDGPLAGKSGLGLNITTCTLWAPACTVDLFKQAYVPAIQDDRIGRFALFTMTDQA
ncbi:MAG: peptidase, partial [Phycisphaerales bacterium]|nr:peptidase [Phycisphaerales bacterium]